jgi:PAS domain S-box-containing protein
VHRDDILALVGLDGITRARRMGGSWTAGDDLRASSLFTELASRDSGNTVSASPVDGVRRLFSFRRLQTYPLVVGAAIAEADALAPVIEREKRNYVRSIVLTGAIALLSGLVIRALSRRKRAVAMLVASEETLRAREQEFRSVTESMPQLVWITDAQGNHSYFNQQWIDYTGLSLAQSVGNGWVAAFHPDDQAGAVKRWDDTVAKDEVYEAEYRLRAANGSYRWMLARALPLRDANHRTTRWFGTSTDIDNQVVAQAQLREQANLLNLTRDAIIVREADDSISFWNEGAERIYGWKADEVLGGRAQDFAYADSAKAVAARRQLAEEGEWSGEVDHLRKDGSTVTVNSRWTAVRHDERTASSVLVVNTDVTEHKKLQGQLLRTQRLESIGTLASGVAHDLNNILAPIMMAAPLLRAEMSAEKRCQLVSLLEQSAERGAGIVRQVLTFARGADGERVLVQPSYSLREIADIATETFPKSITVTADYPEDLALIEADPTQIHQILLNLCVNARDAMSDGGVLALSAENFYVDEHYAAMTPGLQAGPHLSIKVSDTGTGIPPHVMDKIFDPFFTTKGVGTGTGLGLSTVLGIVREYGGTVTAESSGRGTTFRILLPASIASAGADEPLAEEELPRGHGETILVVDDEEAIRTVAERLLHASGYRVLLAEDGPTALGIFAAQAAVIDLVLTDVAMPVMGGIALARTLRKMRPDTCIIVSAGREDDCSLAEMNEIGIAATLPKPYTQTALLRLLDQVISPNRKKP